MYKCESHFGLLSVNHDYIETRSTRALRGMCRHSHVPARGDLRLRKQLDVSEHDSSTYATFALLKRYFNNFLN